MKIRQLQLIGFKSFADKTAISLHDGITCIVGPNGCGKSNIVDAFRWVLGEQSARSLRGEKMEEVIFQGSSTKKIRGMAEVTLKVDRYRASQNGDADNGNGGSAGAVPGEGELSVSRRLYRSGESEYLTNNRQCRLRDIRDIFLDTGLDVRSYSILDQGRISEILNAKAQERRFLIEEVAGVMKYKVKKAEALSKLDSSKQNLQRINDIVTEVKRQIGSLDRQVKKAERYRRLTEEIRAIDLRTAKREYQSLLTALEAVLSEITRARDAEAAKRSELSTIENTVETRRIALIDRERSLTGLDQRLHDLEKRIAELEKAMAVAKTNRENRTDEIIRIRTACEEREKRRLALAARIGELEEEERRLLAGRDDLAGQMREKRDWAEECSIAASEGEELLETKRRQLFSISETLSARRNEDQRLQTTIENLQHREQSSLKDHATLEQAIGDLERRLRELREELRIKEEEQGRLIAEINDAREDFGLLKESLEEKRSELSLRREALISNTSRLHSLRELLIDRTLVEFLSETRVRLHADHLIVSDILSAERDFEQAIEALLSDIITSLVLETPDDILTAAAIVREKNLGRTALLLPGCGGNDATGEGQAPAGPDDLTRALDCLRFEMNGGSDEAAHLAVEAKRMITRLIEGTYIVNDLERALTIIRDPSFPGRRIVTREGEIINRDGTIFVGRGREILKRKREIRELQEITAVQEREVGVLEEAVQSLSEALVRQRESLKEKEDRRIDREKEISLLGHSAATLAEDLERKHRKLSFLTMEVGTIRQEKESVTALRSVKTAEIAAIGEQREALQDEISSLQQSLAGRRGEYEEIRTHLTDLRLSITSLDEKMKSVAKERESTAAILLEIDEKNARAAGEIAQAEETIAVLSEEMKGFEEQMRAAVVDAAAMRREGDDLREAVREEEEAIASLEKSLKTINASREEISLLIADLAGQETEKKVRIEGCSRTVFQKYGLDIAAEPVVTEGFDPSEDEGRLAYVNGRIAELGPVNLAAIEEYAELKARYDFLTAQQKDLTLSIAELEEAISRINSTSRRKLREAYEALRSKFSEVFTLLFGGGKADIILTDEQNILESGIEIIAQPPGKKLQNLNLLSGGEKALTSLSLLFAGFLIKPSPLCILDEVDAPLDEANTSRFARMLGDLSGDTQFIVISHNRTTMEAADYLYGVTMEEPGASKIISLRFSETENLDVAKT